jgi:hypothetical protein
MVLKIIDDKNTWDAFIDSNKHSMIFHKWDFLKTVEKYTENNVLTYGIYYDTQLIGVLPLFSNDILSVKMMFSPPPRTAIPYLGFLLFNEYNSLKQDKKEKFLHLIAEDIDIEFKKEKIDYVSLCLSPEIVDVRPFLWSKYGVVMNYTYILDTSVELEKIWNNLKKETRKKIKQAQSANIKIVYTEDCTKIYEKLEERYIDQKIHLPIISYEYLTELKNYFPNNIFFKQAVIGDEIVGSEIIIRYNNKHIDWLGGVRPEVNYPVNELLIWNSIEQCKENNIKEMDLAGANNKQISEFKSQFNPKIVPTLIISKKNFKGNIMELSYRHLIKKKYF